MHIIINADDLGYSVSVNNAIFVLMEKRLITSATLMANGPGFEDAVACLPNFPWCSIGVHLNVREFQPLTNPPVFKAITDQRGNFQGNIWMVPVNRNLEQAIFDEWCAQIEKILASGVKISHIDSHGHVHTRPRLFLVLKRLQQKFGIFKVRITRNIYPPGLAVSKVHLFKKWLWNFALRNCIATKTTNGFTNFATFLELAKMRILPYSTLELMLHPGWEEAETEIMALKTDWKQEISFKLEMINYFQL